MTGDDPSRTEAKLRDAPRLVSFFICFLVRNNALPECERSLKKAIKLLDLAKEELPRTKVIATAIPDDLSMAFAEAFGSQIPKLDWGDFNPLKRTEDGTEDRSNKKAKLDDEQARPSEPCNWTSVPEDESEPTARVVEINDDDGNATNSAWGAPQWSNDNTWYTNSVGENDVGVGGWGSLGNTNDGWVIPTHFLMTFLGPTTVPITHTVGYVEQAVRQIISWTTPDSLATKEATNSDLLKSFVAVEMAPYKANTLSEPERTSIRQPKLLNDPHAATTGPGVQEDRDEVNVLAHDPNKDRIMVLVLPSTAKTLMKGIGVNATWIQVAPRKVDGEMKKSGKGKAKAKEAPQTWWYMEQVVQVFPSFWEELPASSRNAINGRVA
jgi:hypothetical protein